MSMVHRFRSVFRVRVSRETRGKEVMADTLTNRVNRGAKLLDNHFGLDWVDKIDLYSLNLASVRSCVLGQLFGWYQNGCDALQLENPIYFGFDTTWDQETRVDYDRLTGVWMRYIDHRQTTQR